MGSGSDVRRLLHTKGFDDEAEAAKRAKRAKKARILASFIGREK